MNEFCHSLVSILFKTPNPDKVFAFYSTLFNHLSAEKSNTFDLKISLHKVPKCDLEWKGGHAEKPVQLFRPCTDPDGRTMYMSSDTHGVFCHSLPLPLCSVVVLRSQQVVDTAAFYRQGLSLQEEQHGKGAIHYSSKLGDILLEIYPQRKLFPTSIELICPVENVVVTVERLKQQSLHFLQTFPSVLLQDPDQHLIQLVPHSKMESL